MNRFRMNLGPAVASAPSLNFPPITMADVAEYHLPEWHEAADKYGLTVRIALSKGMTGAQLDKIIEGVNLFTIAGMLEADKRIADAIKAHKPLPHVTLKPEPVKDVKPAISGLTTTWGE